MGNKSCYSNTHRRRRRNTTSNRIALTNTSQHVSHLTEYHIFHDKSPTTHQHHYEIPPIDIFLIPYYNTEILPNDFRNEQECAICFELFCQGDIVARLACLCIYHKQCLDQWSERKRCCPLHMDQMILTNIMQLISSTEIKQEENEQEINVCISNSKENKTK